MATTPGTGKSGHREGHQAHYGDILGPTSPPASKERETSVEVVFRSGCDFHSKTTTNRQDYYYYYYIYTDTKCS